MTPVRAVLLVLLPGPLVACSSAHYGAYETGAPSVVMPAHFAEGHTGKPERGQPEGGAAPGAAGASPTISGSPAPPGPPAKPTFAPDPPPTRSSAQWEYDLEYQKGQVRVASVKRVDLGRPAATARHMGRFAIELRIGKELVDRVRFDFPLLAADTAPLGEHARHPLHEEARFGPGADTRARVRVPASDRATSAVLVDRLTGGTVPLPWPPDAPAEEPPAKTP
jgi:hypothetical protein